MRNDIAIKSSKDNKFHNTKLLLRKYRDIVWSLEVSVQRLQTNFEKEYGSSIDKYLDSVYMAGAEIKGTNLEYHSKCIDKSNKMLNIINQCIELLRTKHKYGETYYWILYYTYLSPQELENVNEIIDNLIPHLHKCISRVTYHTKLNQALNELDTLLWAYTSRDTIDILNDILPT